jgi:tetratricopeptide (TPR) repeat protein
VTTRATPLALLLAALAACATSAPRAPQAPGAPRAAAAAPARERERAAEAAPEATVSARAQRLFDEAVRAEDEQKKLKVPTDWPYLERKWRAVLDADEVAEARYNLGVALEAQGRLGDARAEYERALKAKPSLRQAAVNLGVLLEKQGDARAAAAVYQDAVRDFPEDAVSRERLAELYRQNGQPDDAWRLAREALVRDPRSVTAYVVLAHVAIQRNDLDLAKLVAVRAQKLDPRDPELPFLVGQVLARQGDDPAAAVQFRKALALREGYLPARHALLAAALKKEAWGSVAEHAAALLKDVPGDAGLQLTHGIALRHLGKPEEALAAYARAEKLGGGRLPEVHLARGVLLARVKSECEPALAELAAYRREVPVVPDAAAVTKVQRDCEQMLEDNRKALEAAKQMQADAARQAAEKAAKESKDAKDPKAAPADGGAAPTPAPAPAR